MIIHLNGWPGAGKKTIGAELAKRLHARFIHNHLLHDVAIVCAGYDDPDRWKLYETVRSAAYNVLKTRPAKEVLVMTNALCRGSTREQAAWRHIVDLAMARHVPLVPVILELTPEENFRRLGSEDRQGKKLTDHKELASYFAEEILQKPDVPELLILDVTTLSPAEAAKSIIDHVTSFAPELRPATDQHLEMKR